MNPVLEDLVNNTDYAKLKHFNDSYDALEAIELAKIDAVKNLFEKFDEFFSTNSGDQDSWYLLIEAREILLPRVEKCE